MLRGGKPGRAPIRDSGTVADMFARALTELMAQGVAPAASVRIAGARVRKLAEAAEELDTPSLIGLSSAKTRDLAGLTVLNVAFIERLVEVVSGAIDSVAPPRGRRRFTGVDVALAEGFADSVIAAFETALSTDPALTGVGRVWHARFVQDIEPLAMMAGDLDVWDVTLEVAFTAAETPLPVRFLAALGALDDYRAPPPAPKRPGEITIEAETAWGNAMVSAARRAEVRLVTVLHQRALNVDELDQLEVGAVIPLPPADRIEVELRLDAPNGVAEQPVAARAALGAADGWRAVKLIHGLEPDFIAQLEPYAPDKA